MDDKSDWKKQRKWAWRSGQVEVGSCDEKLSHGPEQNRAEICQWAVDDSSRWTVATFEKTKDGWDLCWVGDRPLRCKRKEFYDCAKVGFLLLSGMQQS